MFTSNGCITYANVKFGTHITCQVATGLNDVFKFFNSKNNTVCLALEDKWFRISINSKDDTNCM